MLCTDLCRFTDGDSKVEQVQERLEWSYLLSSKLYTEGFTKVNHSSRVTLKLYTDHIRPTIELP